MLILAIAVPADLLAATAVLPNTETVNWEVMSQIRSEGFHNSKVMEIEGQLTDVIGPRLTGSPNMKRANEWTRDQFTEWGLVNSHLESFPFGRGWSNEYTEIRMVAPQASPMLAYPKAWTISTNGVVRAPVVKAKLATQADLDKYKGQLAGKIVLNGDMREIKPGEKPALKRYDDKDLADLAQYQIPSEKPRFNREEIAQRIAFQKTLNQYLMDEHVAAIIDPSRAGEAGLVFVQGGASYEPDTPAGVPSLVMAIENYGRITRLLDRNIPVELEIDVRNTVLRFRSQRLQHRRGDSRHRQEEMSSSCWARTSIRGTPAPAPPTTPPAAPSPWRRFASSRPSASSRAAPFASPCGAAKKKACSARPRM